MVGLLLGAFTMTMMVPVLAAQRHRVKPLPPNEHKPIAYWELESVDASAGTISLQKSDSSSNLTLKVTSATKVLVEDKPGKLEELQKGQKVNFSASGGSCTFIDAAAPTAKDKPKGKDEKTTTKKKN
jgi:hypothetical protein